jgi:hypothetical protein
METEGSVLFSQEPATGPRPKPYEPSPSLPIPFPEDLFRYYLAIYAQVFQVVSSL